MSIDWRPNKDFHFTRMAQVSYPCRHCGRTTHYPQKEIETAEVRHWRTRFERLQASLNDMMERCSKEHGDDAVRRWMLRDLTELRDKMRDEEERGF